jgi:hypothetical protein
MDKKTNKWQIQKSIKNVHYGARTHDNKFKSLVFYQLS